MRPERVTLARWCAVLRSVTPYRIPTRSRTSCESLMPRACIARARSQVRSLSHGRMMRRAPHRRLRLVRLAARFRGGSTIGFTISPLMFSANPRAGPAVRKWSHRQRTAWRATGAPRRGLNIPAQRSTVSLRLGHDSDRAPILGTPPDCGNGNAPTDSGPSRRCLPSRSPCPVSTGRIPDPQPPG